MSWCYAKAVDDDRGDEVEGSNDDANKGKNDKNNYENNEGKNDENEGKNEGENNDKNYNENNNKNSKQNQNEEEHPILNHLHSIIPEEVFINIDTSLLKHSSLSEVENYMKELSKLDNMYINSICMYLYDYNQYMDIVQDFVQRFAIPGVVEDKYCYGIKMLKNVENDI